MKKILLIDDDLDLLSLLQSLLLDNGYDVTTATNGKRGLSLIENKTDLVLCDLKLPDIGGLEMISRLRKINPQVPILLITGYSDVKTAVEALRRGAKDYITKPLYPDEILLKIKQFIEENRESVGNQVKDSAKKSNSAKQAISDYVLGESSIMQGLEKNIQLVAPTNMTVVIEGDTGTGKEYAAKRLHSLSKRKESHFISLDCGALPEELAGSALFGHKKGAFTGAAEDKVGHFELANNGTLFLDEVGNLSYDNQVKLLRVLQELKVQKIGDTKEIPLDFRLIVATNEDLKEKVKAGEFREDLFHRLNEFSLTLPSLKERKKDIKTYCLHFLTQANQELEKDITGFTDGVLDTFKQYEWPGNLREMKNVIKRAVLLCEGTEINSKNIPIELSILPDNSGNSKNAEGTLREIAETAEKKAIVIALRKHHYNKTKVATALDIDRKTLYNKIHAYGIKI